MALRDLSAAAFENVYDRVIIGAGLSGIFTAYEILRTAREANKSVSVALVAEKINAPTPAGSHIVYGLDGMFETKVPNHKKINEMMRESIHALEDNILAERIDCSLSIVYKYKAQKIIEVSAMFQSLMGTNIYDPREVTANYAQQILRLPRHPHSLITNAIGQVNMPALLNGLVESIRNMGGHVMLETAYENHARNNGTVQINTDKGVIESRNAPLIATGPTHLQTMPGFTVKTDVIFTMAMVFGPIKPEDRKKYFNTEKAIAFCDSNLSGDVLWGGIDDKGRLTLGRGDLESPNGAAALEADIRRQVEDYFPGLAAKYKPEVILKPMLCTANQMPVVGRMQGYDVMGGWGGRGIVGGYMAARAYAQMVVNKDDKVLQLFEAMQPGAFKGAPSRMLGFENRQPAV